MSYILTPQVENDLEDIARQCRGYIALYRYIPEINIVFILAIRS